MDLSDANRTPILVRLMNQAKPATGTRSCPADGIHKGQDVVIFVSAGGETVVSLSTTGCRDAAMSNHTQVAGD